MSDVTFGVKVPEELKVQIDNLMKDSGLRTGKDFMQQLINNYVVEKTKENVPQVAEDLKELQLLTQRINSIYLNLGYRIENITKAEQEEQQQLLSKKDSTITDLQAKVEKMAIEHNIVLEEYDDLVNLNSEHLKQVNQLTDSNNNMKELISEYKGKIDTLSGIIEEYKDFKSDNEGLKALIADLQAEKVTLNNSIDKSKVEIETISQEVNQLNTKHARDLERLKKEYALDNKLKIAEVREEFNLQISNEQEKHNKQIQEYQDKYKTLLEQLEAKKTTPRKSKKQEQEGQEE